MVISAPPSVGDPYRWLEDGDSARTRQWLRDQRSAYDAQLASWSARRWLSDRIAAWLHRDEWSIPRRRGDREFATLLRAGADHPQLLCRDEPDRPPRVIVDPAVDGGPGAALDTWEPSPSGALISFQISHGGIERGELCVRTVDGGAVVDGPIGGVRYSPVVWLDDERFYYIREAEPTGPGAFRRRGIWLHHVGARVETDRVVFSPSTEWPTVIDVQLEHGRWLVIAESYGTGNRNDLWIADLDRSPAEAPALAAIQHGVDHETRARVSTDGRLYLLTTADAPRRQLCVTRCDQPGIEHWTTVIAHDPGSNLSDVALIHTGGYLAEILAVRGHLGFHQLAAHAPDGALLRGIALPGAGRVQDLAVDHGSSANLIYAGINQPAAVHRYDQHDDRVRPAGLAPPHAETAPPLHRVNTTYQSPDGTTVPIVIISTNPIPTDQPRPTILHGYGSFGEERQFGFSATVLSWLELGGQYAVAYIRGGGDLGRDWHHQGTRDRKANTIDDLIAAADWLVDHGHTTREQLCLSGSSAGGLLMLAAITRRPDVAGAAIASAPIADMARYEQLGIGALWRAEFGTAADPDDLATLLSYSPYHNVQPGKPYPAVLLTGFHGDTRSGAAHPRKMTAALQAATGSDRPILLRYEHDLGHGRKPRRHAIALAAEAHAFAAAHTGLQPSAATDHPQPPEGGEHHDHP